MSRLRVLIQQRISHSVSSPRAAWFVFAIGLFTSLVFVLIIYPTIGGRLDLFLDPEAYGALGRGLLHYRTLSYYPDTHSTLLRGPTFPALVALELLVTGGWYPYAIQIGNALLIATTCVLVYRTVKLLATPSAALVAGLACAVHPVLIGFTGKVVLEPLSICLFTALIYLSARFASRPTTILGATTGVVLAALGLSKGIFLPIVVIAPVWLWALTRRRAEAARALVAMGLCMLLPLVAWSARNAEVGGHFTPSQTLLGFNLMVGDVYMANFADHPFKSTELWEMAQRKYDSTGLSVPVGALRDQYRDSVLIAASLDRYVREPGFLLRKIAANCALFWMLGETPMKSALFALLQFPLLALFALGMWRRRRQLRGSVVGLHLAMVVLYVLPHLPIFAFFRASSVLIPTMVIYADLGRLPAMLGLLPGRRAVRQRAASDPA